MTELVSRERAPLRHIRVDPESGKDVWEIRIFLGRGEDDQQKFRRMRFAGTEAQAQRWRTQQLASADDGKLPKVESRENVEQFTARFLTDTVGPSVRLRTLEGYRALARRYLYPRLGHIKLRQLDAGAVQGLIAELAAPDRVGGPLSPTTVRAVVRLLRHTLAGAKAAGLLSTNPIAESAAVRIPRKNAADAAAEESRIKYLSPEDAETFLDEADKDAYAALWRVAVRCGLRPSELYALRWNDYNRSSRTLRIDESLQPDGSFEPPKTTNGRRTINLGPDVVLALDGHRAEVTRRSEQVPRATDLIFPNADGGTLDHNNMQKRCRAICAAAGVDVVGPYALRHTCATIMLHAGIDPKVAAAVLGHSNVMLFWNTYSHVTQNLTAQAADLTAAYVERVRASRTGA